MTREQAIEKVVELLPRNRSGTTGPQVWAVAEQIVDALGTGQPVVIQEHDWWKTGALDTGTDPPRFLWRCDRCHAEYWCAGVPKAADPELPELQCVAAPSHRERGEPEDTRTAQYCALHRAALEALYAWDYETQTGTSHYRPIAHLRSVLRKAER